MFYDFPKEMLQELVQNAERSRIEREYIKSNVYMFDEDYYCSLSDEDFDEYELM